ncbi:MAG: restriction endonuclease subunit S [Ignavibacteriales bacterium]|nr:restriction endonuclease subunit S [Ignavibacteriales bacterium]
MSVSFTEKRFGDIARVIPGYAFKSDDFGVEGFPVVKIAEIAPPRVDLTNCQRISADKVVGLDRFKLAQDDILIAMTGATLGKVGRFKENVVAYVNQRVAKIDSVEGISDKDFLYYLITDNANNSQIIELGLGSAQANFSGKDLENLQFVVPDLPIQRRVAAILCSLDEKIELNRQTDATLEAIAQEIFKEWFVEFRFPGATGEMIESELGMIPKGWRVGKLGDMYKTTSGGTPSRSQNEYYENGINQWVKSKELNGSFVIDTEEKITDEALRNSAAKLIPKHSVLVAMYGATVGEIGIVSNEATTNQAICAFIPNDSNPFTFVFQFLQNSRDDLISRAVGSAQQNISQELLKNLVLTIPDSQTMKEYHTIIEPLFSTIEENLQQSSSLTKIRDNLLPKLMCGEIEV